MNKFLLGVLKVFLGIPLFFIFLISLIKQTTRKNDDKNDENI